jgi:SAM-dependent methyltransferase
MVAVDNGWGRSAAAWIADMGEHGDFGRRYVLDPVMLARAMMHSPVTALDVGCGEGRFCRMLTAQGIRIIGIDPTPVLLAAARRRDPRGTYLQGTAEYLPLRDQTFDLVVSYLSLIDIPDIEAATREMARVLKPGGRLLIANLTSFNTACGDRDWIFDKNGRRLHRPLDHYLEERSMWVEWKGIRIINYHRPLHTYFNALLGAGLQLTYFDEPAPIASAPASRAASYRRVPWFLAMEWRKG